MRDAPEHEEVDGDQRDLSEPGQARAGEPMQAIGEVEQYQAGADRGDHVAGGPEEQDADLPWVMARRLQADSQNQRGNDEVAGVLENQARDATVEQGIAQGGATSTARKLHPLTLLCIAYGLA